MDRSRQPAIQPLKDFHIQTPVRMLLPNGVPLAVISAGEQEVVRIDILFRAGRWLQVQRLQALFANRMLREGTARYTTVAIAEKLDFYGSWLELSVSPEYAHLTVYALNKYVAETLEVVESMVKEPTFPEKELHTVLETDMRRHRINLSKVDFLAQRSLMRALYGAAHPCGNLVEEDDYRRITPELLRDFYIQYYHSGNCSVFLSGRVTEEIIDRVSGVFGSPFGCVAQRPLRPEFSIEPLAGKRFFTERKDALQSAVKLGCTTIGRKHPDYLKLRVLVTLFGGYFGSRLMSNIREEKGYTYGISAGTFSYPDSGVLLVSTEADNEYVEPLIGEVYAEIERLHREPVPEAELEMVRNYMLGEMCRNYESPFSLAEAWIFLANAGLEDDYFSRSLRAVQEATPAELQALAQRYLCKETLKEVIAGKNLA